MVHVVGDHFSGPLRLWVGVADRLDAGRRRLTQAQAERQPVHLPAQLAACGQAATSALTTSGLALQAAASAVGTSVIIAA